MAGSTHVTYKKIIPMLPNNSHAKKKKKKARKKVLKSAHLRMKNTGEISENKKSAQWTISKKKKKKKEKKKKEKRGDS